MQKNAVDLSDPLQFDIKLKSPHSGLDYNDPWFDPTAKLTYFEINFMVRLMWGIEYGIVHGPFRDLIPRILTNINNAAIWPEEYARAKPILEHHLGQMADMEVVQEGLTHLSLYIGYNPNAEAFVRESNVLRMNLAAAGERFLLCLPYIDHQVDEAKIWPDPVELENASSRIAAFNIHQLYLSADAKHEVTSIRHLRNSGVLRTMRPMRAKFLAGGQGNNYKCENNDCKYLQNHFCSKDSEGNCSAMSDP